MDKRSIFGLHIIIAHDTSLWDQLLKENILLIYQFQQMEILGN